MNKKYAYLVCSPILVNFPSYAQTIRISAQSSIQNNHYVYTYKIENDFDSPIWKIILGHSFTEGDDCPDFPSNPVVASMPAHWQFSTKQGEACNNFAAVFSQPHTKSFPNASISKGTQATFSIKATGSDNAYSNCRFFVYLKNGKEISGSVSSK